jgi:FAD/FMN-containing dehydrogenase
MSWGRVQSHHHLIAKPSTVDEAAGILMQATELPKLPYGCGRSYGDVALNPGGILVDCGGLDRFVTFDPKNGILECEAGVRLADILSVICRPRRDGSGWFLPVLPGTRYVTVGGAIANDIHGKNHQRFGTFGDHIISVELARSDGSRLSCSRHENSAMFAATIGGLGLTGIMLRAKLQLRHVEGLALEAEDIRFRSLDDYYTLATESESEWEYSAAWVDCLAGPQAERGVFSRARHVAAVSATPPEIQPKWNIPMALPFSAISPQSTKLFNAIYRRRLGRAGRAKRTGNYAKVFFPLDTVGAWNRLYGPRGFFQFQCVLPKSTARDALPEIFARITEYGEASMLAVLKEFGSSHSPGLLSFPMEGSTLAIDFPNRGDNTVKLLKILELIVVAASGRLYPAKDGVMSADTFQHGFPHLNQFRSMVDPSMSSGFAKRVGIIQ